jgi:hypothetical protein
MTQARVLVVAGILLLALYVTGAVALGTPPQVDDSNATIAAWFLDNRDAARLYAWTATFATLAVAILAAIIRGLLPAPHRDVFLLGAAAFAVETAVQAWFWAGLALDPGSLDPATVRLGFSVVSFWGPVLTGATMAMIGAVTALGLRAEPAIPRWLTIIGVIAFLEQAIETITVFGTSGFTAPGGAMNLQLGATVTIVWIIALVIWARRELGDRSLGTESPAQAA